WKAARFNSTQLTVIKAQLRTLARHVRNTMVLPALRDVKRLLTYSPVRLLREHRSLSAAEAVWNGDLLFLFPYLNTGGAEQVHADIIMAVTDRKPLVVITGVSADHAFRETYAAHAHLLELHHLLNHPFTRNRA
ncbi:MAG: hypothetical protein ACK6A5_07145, partial [Flavobacteriales bacterium]